MILLPIIVLMVLHLLLMIHNHLMLREKILMEIFYYLDLFSIYLLLYPININDYLVQLFQFDRIMMELLYQNILNHFVNMNLIVLFHHFHNLMMKNNMFLHSYMDQMILHLSMMYDHDHDRSHEVHVLPNWEKIMWENHLHLLWQYIYHRETNRSIKKFRLKRFQMMRKILHKVIHRNNFSYMKLIPFFRN